MNKKDRFLTHVAIVERAEKLGLHSGERTSVLMDIESADLHFNMRLDDWLKADDENFTHDFVGIVNNIDRSNYPATEFNLFVPRFAS